VESMHTARIAVLVAAALLAAAPMARAQDARQRQAAAEAYDQGTAAYLAGDYEKAAEWFETANRLAPAAPALIQAARSAQQAGQPARAATLALRLTTEYASEPAAVEFGEGILQQFAGQLLRIDVVCEGCTLDVNGTLQEWKSFFVPADEAHVVTASFETGDRRAEVGGQPGEVKTLEFEAPPPQATTEDPSSSGQASGSSWAGTTSDRDKKPLPPVVTFVGIGLTVALAAGSIVSGLDANAGADGWEDAVAEYDDNCDPVMPKMDAMACDALYDAAREELEAGEGKETRTNVLWIATGVVGVATAAIALFLTDWKGEGEKAASRDSIDLALVPGPRDASLVVKGTF
jgi:tetratricopeptide (TPR) repeat protein